MRSSRESNNNLSSSRNNNYDRNYNDSHRSNNNYSRRSSRDDESYSSGPIDPSKPQWWNDQKKSERRASEQRRRDEIRSENERRKIASGNAVTYNTRTGRGVQIQDARVGAQNGNTRSQQEQYDRKIRNGAGAYNASDSNQPRNAKEAEKLKKMNMDMMDIHDDRLGRGKTADEELEGRSIWDLVDRGTLMVGCCLILVVIIAVTIPVALISEDEPYVMPRAPNPPSQSPTQQRQPVEDDIMLALARITPGGEETLQDTSTAHHRAWQWLVYEDGMELGPSKDHLHQRYVLMVIYFISGPWTPVEGRLEWGSPVHECEWEGIYCKDVEELEEELEGRIDELLEVGREDGIKIDVPQRIANRLELRQRLVSGEVPAEFSLLYYLQHLVRIILIMCECSYVVFIFIRHSNIHHQ